MAMAMGVKRSELYPLDVYWWMDVVRSPTNDIFVLLSSSLLPASSRRQTAWHGFAFRYPSLSPYCYPYIPV
jgi:hypothetical protein